jgi:hypothetical protein
MVLGMVKCVKFRKRNQKETAEENVEAAELFVRCVGSRSFQYPHYVAMGDRM